MEMDQADRTLWTDMVDDLVEDRIGIQAEVAYFAGFFLAFGIGRPGNYPAIPLILWKFIPL